MRMSRMIPMIIPAPNPPPSSCTTLGPPAGGFTLTWPNLNLLALSRPTLSQAACREGASFVCSASMRLGPLRHRWFAAFTGAIGLGGLGDEVARLALPLLILDLTHSIGAAATLRLVQALPYVFFGGIAGVLIDRAEKRKLLIACDVLSIAITSAIPLSVMAGVFSLDLLYFIGFLLGTVEVAWGV